MQEEEEHGNKGPAFTSSQSPPGQQDLSDRLSPRWCRSRLDIFMEHRSATHCQDQGLPQFRSNETLKKEVVGHGSNLQYGWLKEDGGVEETEEMLV